MAVVGKEQKSSKKQAPIATSPSLKSHPTREELHATGKSLRDQCLRESHADWKPAVDRPDPLALMEESKEGRLLDLRHLHIAIMSIALALFVVTVAFLGTMPIRNE